MSAWEALGQTDEWYTPAYVFHALGETFDMDVAAPPNGGPHVPADLWISARSLEVPWHGFVWMNPPYGGRNALASWVQKFLDHGDGLALVPDRTSAPWFAPILARADAVLFVARKIRFVRPDGSTGSSPGSGSAIFAMGPRGVSALQRASRAGLGGVVYPMREAAE